MSGVIAQEATGLLNLAYSVSKTLNECKTKEFVIKQRKLIDDIMIGIGEIIYVLQEEQLIRCKCNDNELPTGINYSIKKDYLGCGDKCICIKGKSTEVKK